MRDPDPQNLRHRLAALQRNRASCRPEDADKVNEDDSEIAVIEEELERIDALERLERYNRRALRSLVRSRP